MGNRAHTTCKSLCRPSLARPSPSRLKPATPLMPSRLRSRTRKESLQTSSVSSSPASSSRTAARSRITTSKGVHPASCSRPCWWRQEAQEEDLHQAKEDQAQEEERQALDPQVLQG